ncbi:MULTISPECIES: DUF2271 domain-containing protein [Sphingobium]|uniref:DUF2271 domain-containing protein n=1 Tax=Sphingobium TaxID=165695 RepID=UPI0015EB8B08|nr:MULTISPECIES: DUF2271 domain-containing protein [Sphingobium]MCW2349328.1 hypothetical protein [Sphingobium sp. B12D2B]MCW2363971.1 hypothetical protein [Sphingobium sp. B10D3B]MCW2367522.1 hypothetical protein [Sphingobium sp. B7D2B]MCW2391877.1 hypothetical protein [Sphingobium sp. B11D3A]MCW2402632.1 hypothetical protein [Sphingobium sp. B10D7B]
MKKTSLVLAGLVATPATAGTISVTIPRLNVAEYHRPYVAAWVEPTGGGAAQTIFVWYDVKLQGREPGTKWLSDLRTWWRKGGRSLKLPADGVSSATRAPGTHKIALPATLKPGQYTLYVEAARETGGREIVSIPLQVPAKGGSATGKSELGAITISAR